MNDEAPPLEPEPGDVVRLDAPQSARDIRDATLIKEGDLFLLTDLSGNAPLASRDGFGLYYRDTRFLGGYELVIEGLRPTVLLSNSRSQFMSAQVLANPNLVMEDGTRVDEQTLQIRRYRVVRGDSVAESLTVQNFNVFPLRLSLAFRLRAMFEDIFEVRGIVRPHVRGELREPEFRDGVLTFRYHGRDGIDRETSVTFDPPPTSVIGGTVKYALDIPASGAQRIAITVRIAERGSNTTNSSARASLVGYRQFLSAEASIETSSDLFNAMFLRARLDLRALLGGQQDERFVCAGIPWYATLFGRDSIITALADLWLSPALARHTLRLLARHQGQREDDERDEEPGKILHELRRGELANLGVIPFGPYYGSVDATLLWIILLAETYRATADLELVRELAPNLEAALAWIDRYADLDGDGFVEYRCRSPRGLFNQGWKDSADGIPHADGLLAEPPIALVEVQAYLFAALRGAARLLRVLGRPDRARLLLERAGALAIAFHRAFWLEGDGFYAMALDGAKRKVATIGSNAGHALFAGIVSNGHAERIAQRLVEEDMFSGFGIRTLSSRERRYNPASYHLGSVWPHDNAMTAIGMKRYGHEPLVSQLFTGLFDAAQGFPDLRLPELFCGFARTAFGTPVRYPVACSPQAWAAASWSPFLQAALGVLAVAPERELRITKPCLPPWLKWVDVKRVPVGSGEVDLHYERIGDHTAVDVRAMRGDVRVTLVSRWDPEGDLVT